MPKVVASLVIAIDDAGQVSVNGPLENRVLCYGLLGVAKDTICELAGKNKAQIVAPPAGLRFPSVS